MKNISSEEALDFYLKEFERMEEPAVKEEFKKGLE